MKQIPLIIDTDPGIDDAVAIALAVFNPRFDVRLITTVAGNVSIEATTTNALKLMAYYGKDVPVARGAAEPLIRQLDDASDIPVKPVWRDSISLSPKLNFCWISMLSKQCATRSWLLLNPSPSCQSVR